MQGNFRKGMGEHQVTGQREFLKKLVKIPSLSGQEGAVADAVKIEMEKLGYDRIIVSGGNVCGIRGEGGVKVLYDAHMDVVEPGNEWKTDPYGAFEKDGFLYGRGTCDDKGSIAAMVYGGAEADVAGATLYVLASVREEVSEGNGLKDFLSRTGIKPDFVIIGEPSRLMVARGNRGRLGLRIDVMGKASHASRPQDGENAIYRAMKIAEEIKNMDKNSPADTVSVTKIETPNLNINVIPEKCSIYCDYRSAPGRTREEILEKFYSLIEKRDKIEVIKKYFKPWSLEESHPLIAAGMKCRNDTLGEAPSIMWIFCTNGTYTSAELGIPTMGFGPGEESQCHSADEKIDLKQLDDAVKYFSMLPGFILREIKEN